MKCLVSVVLSFVLLTGCTAVNTPLPANAVNSIDAKANTVLQTAFAFAARMTTAVQSTDPQIHIELTPTQKNLLMDLNRALNIADPIEQAYHASPTTVNETALTPAIARVQSSLTAAQIAIPTGGK